MKIFIVAFITLSCCFGNLQAQKMNNEKLQKILVSVCDSVQGRLGYWQMKYGKANLMMITDEKHNRMRIITPIAQEKDLEDKHYKESLKANFHTALDVKYAISEGYMWSIFVHPLKELSADQVKDAIRQVYFAAATFGYTYSSTDLVFPGN
ncbi:MAG: YbjN domain-containing protein [Flavobacteriales bacterium]|nr:YbjN domain-containing protein [Flavobacteriales bacterium]